MQTLTVNLGDRSYPIFVGPGLLPRAGEFLKRAGLRGKRLRRNIGVPPRQKKAKVHLLIFVEFLAGGSTIGAAPQSNRTILCCDREILPPPR